MQSASGGAFDEISLQAIFGFLCSRCLLIGIPSNEILQVGQLIGVKIFATEFFAFSDLAAFGSWNVSSFSFSATFALCGFANFMSIGIQMEVLGLWFLSVGESWLVLD